MHNCMSILSNREKHNVINSKGSYCPKGSIISPASHRVLLTPQIYYGGFLIMFPDAKWHIFSGEITSALFIFDLIPLSMKFWPINTWDLKIIIHYHTALTQSAGPSQHSHLLCKCCNCRCLVWCSLNTLSLVNVFRWSENHPHHDLASAAHPPFKECSAHLS